MRNNMIIFLIALFAYSCNNDDTSQVKPKKDRINKKYDIETVTYWDIENQDQDTIPFIVVKVDTINHIGSGVRYTVKGELFEKIVIFDKTNAIKLDYVRDTIATSQLCKYKIRKDHPTKESYSIVVW